MGQERRGNIRHAIREQISYTVNQCSYSSETIDISRGGIKFDTSQLLPPLTPTTIAIHHQPGMTFHGVIMWSGRVNSHCSAAIRFAELSPEQEQFLEQLL